VKSATTTAAAAAAPAAVSPSQPQPQPQTGGTKDSNESSLFYKAFFASPSGTTATTTTTTNSSTSLHLIAPNPFDNEPVTMPSTIPTQKQPPTRTTSNELLNSKTTTPTTTALTNSVKTSFPNLLQLFPRIHSMKTLQMHQLWRQRP
jgi:hypothetical protein